MPESVSSCCPSARHAGRFDCLMSTEQPHSDNNEQWQGALCMVAVLQGSSTSFPNKPTEKLKIEKMYAIKQIKICAEYRDMLPRPRLDSSGTPGLRPIGLSPGSWQTSLGLGSMSRYSAQILICIFKMTWSIVWVIMGRRGVSSERRRSSCSSFYSFNTIDSLLEVKQH